MNAVQPTVFNPAQLYLLEVFSRIQTDEELLDIKKLISDYYAKKMDKMLVIPPEGLVCSLRHEITVTTMDDYVRGGTA